MPPHCTEHAKAGCCRRPGCDSASCFERFMKSATSAPRSPTSSPGHNQSAASRTCQGCNELLAPQINPRGSCPRAAPCPECLPSTVDTTVGTRCSLSAAPAKHAPKSLKKLRIKVLKYRFGALKYNKHQISIKCVKYIHM